jgi:hypothetical protein
VSRARLALVERPGFGAGGAFAPDDADEEAVALPVDRGVAVGPGGGVFLQPVEETAATDTRPATTRRTSADDEAGRRARSTFMGAGSEHTPAGPQTWRDVGAQREEPTAEDAASRKR